VSPVHLYPLPQPSDIALLIAVAALESEIVIISWKHWVVALSSSSSSLSLCGGLLARFFEGI
jgi:hypothetical protein